MTRDKVAAKPAGGKPAPTGARPVQHTTTVRFDADAWDAITRHARRLGIPRAAVIRAATVAELVRREERDRHDRATFGTEIEALHERVRRLERVLLGRVRHDARHPRQTHTQTTPR